MPFMWALYFSLQVNIVEAGTKCVLFTMLHPATNVISGMYMADTQVIFEGINDWWISSLLS